MRAVIKGGGKKPAKTWKKKRWKEVGGSRGAELETESQNQKSRQGGGQKPAKKRCAKRGQVQEAQKLVNES